MGILYAISILAFCALLWAALSVARHVRRSHTTDEPVTPATRKTDAADRPVLVPEQPATQPIPRVREPQPRPFEFFDPREFQSHPTQTPRPAAPAPAEELQTHDLPIHGVRRAPRPASTARVSERLDWAYFNKDLGDLTDPEASTRPRNQNPPPQNLKQA